MYSSTKINSVVSTSVPPSPTPTLYPTEHPSVKPTQSPTDKPTLQPTSQPTIADVTYVLDSFSFTIILLILIFLIWICTAPTDDSFSYPSTPYQRICYEITSKCHFCTDAIVSRIIICFNFIFRPYRNSYTTINNQYNL